MNKSEIELQNVQNLINQMPAGEREMCARMVDSLNASIGHPLHGRVFMLAVAYVNCQVAVTTIRLGLVNADGSVSESYPATRKEENAAIDKIAFIQAKGFTDFASRHGEVSDESVGSEMMDGYNRVRDLSKALDEGVPRETNEEKKAVTIFWPQHGMTHERYREANGKNGGEITKEEIANGWFFDDEYDGLLANHAWEGHE